MYALISFIFSASLYSSVDFLPPPLIESRSLTASLRWFSNQWGPERLAEYPRLVGIWVQENGSISGETDWEEVFAKHMECMQREIAEGISGETFDSIVDSRGRDNVVVVSETSKSSPATPRSRMSPV
jgi:hypothetical protein